MANSTRTHRQAIYTPVPAVRPLPPLHSAPCTDGGILEPVFYLHHANLDRVYWQWQSRDLAARLRDVSGSVEMLGPLTGPNVTLAFGIDVGPLAPEVSIAQLMDIGGGRKGTGVLCYAYE